MILVLNFGTASQMAFQMPDKFLPDKILNHQSVSPITFLPYFDGRFLAVAASLNGGNVLDCICGLLSSWCYSLTGIFHVVTIIYHYFPDYIAGISLPKSEIWEKVEKLLSEENSDVTSSEKSWPLISAGLFGERHDPESRLNIELTSDTNLDLLSMFKGVVRGLVSNLRDMVSEAMLLENGISTVRLVVKGGQIGSLILRETKFAYPSISIELEDIVPTSVY